MPKYNIETSVDTIYEDIEADLLKIFEEADIDLYDQIHEEVYKLCQSYLEETNRLSVLDLIKHINKEAGGKYEDRYSIFANEAIQELEYDIELDNVG